MTRVTIRIRLRGKGAWQTDYPDAKARTILWPNNQETSIAYWPGTGQYTGFTTSAPMTYNAVPACVGRE